MREQADRLGGHGLVVRVEIHDFAGGATLKIHVDLLVPHEHVLDPLVGGPAVVGVGPASPPPGKLTTLDGRGPKRLFEALVPRLQRVLVHFMEFLPSPRDDPRLELATREDGIVGDLAPTECLLEFGQLSVLHLESKGLQRGGR